MIKWNTPSCHCFFRGGAIPGAYQPGCWGALVHLEKWSNLIAEIHRLIYIQLHWQAVRTNDANSKKKLYTRDGTKVLDLGHHDFPTDIGHPFNNIPLRYLHAMVLTLDILRPPGIPITPAKILNIPIILRVTTFIQGKNYCTSGLSWSTTCKALVVLSMDPWITPDLRRCTLKLLTHLSTDP